MPKNKIIPYNPKLKEYARQLRKNSTLSETLLWQSIKNRALGVQFHRQVPLLEYIVDFYCHEIKLAIEIDGDSHEYRYEQDAKRQGELEKRGVEFIRFSDNTVKNDMFSVLLALEEKLKNLVENTPLDPNSKGGSRIASPTSPFLPPQGGNKFPKKERLKSQKLIEQVFLDGKAVTQFPIKLIYLKHGLIASPTVQAGFVAPKKNFKSAVKRNRIKRLLRETYRLNKHTLFNNIEGNYALMILYLGKELPQYKAIEEKMVAVLGAFIKKVSNEERT